MPKPSKMKVVETLTVKTHARQLYIPLPSDMVNVFHIQAGDRVTVEFLEIHRIQAGEGNHE